MLELQSAVIPETGVEPQLRADLEAALRPGETLEDFVVAAVRKSVSARRAQIAFDARAEAAFKAYILTGESVPVETVLARLQSKLDAKRELLGLGPQRDESQPQKPHADK